LASLEDTVRALASIRGDAPSGVADSVIAALRAEGPPESSASNRQPELTVVRGTGVRDTARSPLPRGARAAVRFCLARPQLRITLPIALVAGVVLIMINMGGQLVSGRFDLGMCGMCTADFIVPFVVLNVGLLAALYRPIRRRSGRSRRLD
jgi:hypothetical protein